MAASQTRPDLRTASIGNAHVRQPVQRIENAEDVDALTSRFAEELGHDIVGIRGVAHGIRRTQQHLEAHIGNRLAQLLQSLPGILVQKPQSDIESRAAPHLQAVKIGQPVRDEIRDRQHVVACERASPSGTGARRGTWYR